MADLAILAGGGALPGMIARAQSADVFIIALTGFADPKTVAAYPHVWVRVGQIGRIFDVLKRNQIKQLVFAGHVTRPSWAQIRPDWTGLKLLWQLKKQPRGDDGLLRFLAQQIEKQGVQVVGADTLVPDSIMTTGVMTAQQPTNDDDTDIAYALRILQPWARADQGQAIVVQQGIILGVEAIEGTDELIQRCGGYKRPGRPPILVKIKKPQQDRRLDLPTIGERTVRLAADAGFGGIAVEAGSALFLQPAQAITAADKAGLFIAGIDVT